jgi:hypothetical protein
MRTLLFALIGLGLAVSCVSEGDENTPAAGGTTSSGGAPSGGADPSGGAAESGGAPPAGTAGAPAGDSQGGANTGGDANAGGQFTQGGQAGAGGDAPVPSDPLLYKLVEPGSSFEVVVGYGPLPDMQDKATELGADGYVITTARWNIVTGNSDMRYVAVKPKESTISYDVVVGYEPLSDMQGKATELAADGYVVTTAVWDMDSNVANVRYVATKPKDGMTAGEASLGYWPLSDAQAEATELAADGYLVTTAMWDTDGSPFNMRYFAFTR